MHSQYSYKRDSSVSQIIATILKQNCNKAKKYIGGERCGLRCGISQSMTEQVNKKISYRNLNNVINKLDLVDKYQIP